MVLKFGKMVIYFGEGGDNIFVVGQYTDKFNQATNQNLPCGNIFQSEGLYKHIIKRHPNELENINYIPQIISSPDYIGKNPKESKSIELVKKLENNVQVCIKLDKDGDYLYVASVYEISEAKVKNRLKSGRLKTFY